jgi:hypothetical protein
MVPSHSTAHAPLARRLLPPALLVLSALALMLAIAASSMPALAGVPAAAPRGNAVPVAASATPIPTPQCTSAWELEDVPLGQTSGRLLGIDDVAPNDIWAVGMSNNDPRIEHFDGTSWTAITPTIVFTRGLLYDVSAVSANDVWAVGENAEPIISRSGLLLHYNGTEWAKVTYPNPATGDLIYSVDAVTSDEVWAVGSNILGAGPFVLRWNGTNWMRVTAPPLAPTSRLHAVAAVDTMTTTHVWAVGFADPGSNQYPIIMHYDGAQWSTTPVAVIGALYNIAAVSPTDIWAVGTSAESTLRTLVMHYDGVAWTRSPAPFVGELRGIHALSANDIWATGSRSSTQDSGGTTRVLHWDGTSWSAVQSPVLDSGGGMLYDVRVTSPSPEVWAVGMNNETPPARQLIARYHSVCPQPLACQPGWNVVDTIDINPDMNALLSVDASAPDNVWAVGMAGLQGMASQWNGYYWLPTSIGVTPDETQLWGVSAIAPDDVWAVGFTYEAGGAGKLLAPHARREVPLWDTRTVIVHWDGTEWTRVPSPNPNPGLENTLWGVDGISANDVWAVGVTHGQGFILHWNGSSWTQEPLPPGVTVGYLRDVEAVTADDVWAVGATSEGIPSRTVVLRRVGGTWTQVPSPNPGIDPGGGNYLESIDALSPDNIWAVGAYQGSAGSGSLTLHWDGAAWTHVQAPSIGWLTGVSGSGPNDVWAVGDPVTSNVLALHWTGSGWSVVDLPDPPEAESILWGVAAPSQNEVWVAGYTGGILDSRTLIERYVGSCQTPTPTPAMTPTPIPPDCMWVWDSMDIPAPEGTDGVLQGIEALSANDIWAVGTTGEMLIGHWNGSHWTVMPPPGVITEGMLLDVSAVAANDVWAVGLRYTSGSYTPAAFRWDGVQWADVPVPTEPGLNYYLHAVDTITTDNVWVVGWTTDPTTYVNEALVMRWNGTVWTRVPVSITAPYSALHGISAFSASDMWAVGYKDNGALILRWNGTAWTEIPSGYDGRLFAVEAASPNDAWAVGYNVVGSTTRASILHWNGTAWTESAFVEDATLQGIDALAPNDVWAVGETRQYGEGLAMHWDGAQWSTAPEFGSWGGSLGFYDVAVISPTEVWAVGEIDTSGNQYRPLAARYSLRCPEPVTCQPGWNVIPNLDPDPVYNSLYGVDASAPNDVWAVGGTPGSGALVKRWNGTTWQLMPPAPVTSDTILQDVRVFSPAEVWAVGREDVLQQRPGVRPRKGDDVPEATGVILRWNGTQWMRYASPGWGSLFAIDGTSPTDMWAVGYSGNQTFILRWNGAQWMPEPARPGSLYGVRAIAPDDVWAVGNVFTRTLTLHWDGSEWTQEPSPNPGTLDQRLIDVDATGPNDVWAVGETSRSGNPAFVLRWNGTQWTEVPTAGNALEAVSVLAPNDVWALQWGDSPANPFRVIRWNGTQWAVHDLPSPVSNGWWLEDLVAISSNEVWAVGGRFDLAHAGRSLVERYVGTCQTVTPTPSATAIATHTVTPSATRTPTATHTATLPPGITVTPTPTACTITFADVPPTNTFYPFARCLACRGIISGYPCGGTGEPCNPNNDPYFRPDNYVTRGQLAKIVSESAGFEDEIPPSQWTFTDVPYGSTFWVWVERLADRTVMAGYTCGGPNEPCDPDNRPYFRPGAGATRGQLTKIVSNAAGFNDNIPPAQFTFTDVPPSHTFWLYIERLLLNRPGVMAGYQCGGPGEPCDPQNRPYFRPNNPLTRGQTSKIVANTFFPGCDPPRR